MSDSTGKNTMLLQGENVEEQKEVEELFRGKKMDEWMKEDRILLLECLKKVMVLSKDAKNDNDYDRLCRRWLIHNEKKAVNEEAEDKSKIENGQFRVKLKLPTPTQFKEYPKRGTKWVSHFIQQYLCRRFGLNIDQDVTDTANLKYRFRLSLREGYEPEPESEPEPGRLKPSTPNSRAPSSQPKRREEGEVQKQRINTIGGKEDTTYHLFRVYDAGDEWSDEDEDEDGDEDGDEDEAHDIHIKADNPPGQDSGESSGNMDKKKNEYKGITVKITAGLRNLGVKKSNILVDPRRFRLSRCFRHQSISTDTDDRVIQHAKALSSKLGEQPPGEWPGTTFRPDVSKSRELVQTAISGSISEPTGVKDCGGGKDCIDKCVKRDSIRETFHRFHGSSQKNAFLKQFAACSRGDEEDERKVRFVVFYDYDGERGSRTNESCAILAKGLEYVQDEEIMKKNIRELVNKSVSLVGTFVNDGQVHDERRERIMEVEMESNDQQQQVDQLSTEIHDPQRKVGRALFHILLKDRDVTKYDSFRFVVLSPNRNSIADQTKARFQRFVEDCSSAHANSKGKIRCMPVQDVNVLDQPTEEEDQAGAISRSCYALNAGKDNLQNMINLFKNVKNNPNTLFLAIQDESHWGIERHGQVASLMEGPLLLQDAPENLLILYVSATPYNFESQIKTGRFIRMFKRYNADESGVLAPTSKEDNCPRYMGLAELTRHETSISFRHNRRQFEMYGPLATRWLPQSDAALILDYCLALVLARVQGNPLENSQGNYGFDCNPDPKTVDMMRELANTDGEMRVLVAARMRSIKVATFFAEEICRVRDKLSYHNKFAVVTDTGDGVVIHEGDSFKASNKEDLWKYWFGVKSQGKMSMEKFGRISSDRNILLLVIDKGRMGDTFPPHFRVWDLRARYTKMKNLMKSSFYQDTGRAMGWEVSEQRSRPELWLSKMGYKASDLLILEDKDPTGKRYLHKDRYDKLVSNLAPDHKPDSSDVEADGGPDSQEEDVDWNFSLSNPTVTVSNKRKANTNANEKTDEIGDRSTRKRTKTSFGDSADRSLAADDGDKGEKDEVYVNGANDSEDEDDEESGNESDDESTADRGFEKQIVQEQRFLSAMAPTSKNMFEFNPDKERKQKPNEQKKTYEARMIRLEKKIAKFRELHALFTEDDAFEANKHILDEFNSNEPLFLKAIEKASQQRFGLGGLPQAGKTGTFLQLVKMMSERFNSTEESNPYTELMDSLYHTGVEVAHWYFNDAELAAKYVNRYQKALGMEDGRMLPRHLEDIAKHNDNFLFQILQDNADKNIMIADLGSGTDKRLARYYAARNIRVDSYDAGFEATRGHPHYEYKSDISNLGIICDGTYDCSVLSLSAVGQSPGRFIREALRITKFKGNVYFVEETRRLSQPTVGGRQSMRTFLTWLQDLNLEIVQVRVDDDENVTGPNIAKLTIRSLKVIREDIYKKLCQKEDPIYNDLLEQFQYTNVDAVIEHAGDDLVNSRELTREHLKLL